MSTEVDHPADTASGHRPSEFTANWQEWLAENLLRGVADHKLQAVMGRSGFAGTDVATWINAIRASPTFRAADRVEAERRKLRTLVDALSEQWRQSPTAGTVPVLPEPDPQIFFERYYYANRPVLVRGLIDGWPALGKWSPSYFAQRYGDVQVEITSERATDPRYEDNFGEHRRTVLLRDFVATVRDDDTNDQYLVAKNALLGRAEFADLHDDLRCPEGFLDPATIRQDVKLWLGPRGTVTPLHHDASNILFVQVYGTKRVKLVEPHDLPRVYNDRECFSSVDLAELDLVRYPEMASVPVAETVVRPGDALLIPLGWWHWVAALEPSISLSFTGFVAPRRPVVWRYR
jgi:hypothetical protein